MNTPTITKIWESPNYLEQAANWFSQKWGVPAEAYRESMQQCIKQRTGVPQWYFVLEGEKHIIAGAGIIENDFHDRKDLSPNVCALFVEEEYRNRGIAKELLRLCRKEMGDMGYQTLYLVTDHTSFYERYGWEFHTMVTEEDGNPIRMYVAPTL